MTEKTTYQCDSTGREFHDADDTVRVTIKRLTIGGGDLVATSEAVGHLDATELEKFADEPGTLIIYELNGSPMFYRVQSLTSGLSEFTTPSQRQAAHKLVYSLTQ